MTQFLAPPATARPLGLLLRAGELFARLPVPTLLIDAPTRVVLSTNPAAEALFGRPTTALVGLRLDELATPADPAHLLRLADELRNGTRPAARLAVSLPAARPGPQPASLYLAPAGAGRHDGVVLLACVVPERAAPAAGDTGPRPAVEAEEPTGSGLPGLDALSARERDVVERLVSGERVADIAAAVYLSPSTIRNHLSSAFRKLSVRSQAELLERFRQEAPDRGHGTPPVP